MKTDRRALVSLISITFLTLATGRLDADPRARLASRQFSDLEAHIESRASGSVVLFDAAHGETSGNADWTITGGFSDWADDLMAHGYQVEEHAQGPLTAQLLAKVKILVLPEPNKPFSPAEQTAIQDFVAGGGGLFAIGDHENSDRDKDGFDSVQVFNQFLPVMGLKFATQWFTLDPMRATFAESPLTAGVRRMGSWGGTGIELVSERAVGHIILPAPYGTAFLATSVYGSGRIVALGDSSCFDDGTGNPRDKLHDGYNRPSFDMPQMGLNGAHWLDGREPETLVKDDGSTKWMPGGNGGPHVLIDLGHANHDADMIGDAATEMEKTGLDVYYTKDPLDAAGLAEVSLLIVTDPLHAFTADEIEAIRSRVHAGMGLLVTGRSDFEDQSNPGNSNELLEGIGASWRVNDDQVTDGGSNLGRDFMVLARSLPDPSKVPGVRAVLFPSGASLVNAGASGASRALLAGVATTTNTDRDAKGDATLFPRGEDIVLAGTDVLGQGRVAVVGAPTFSNRTFGRPENDSASPGPSPHQTMEFDLALTRWLVGR